MQQQEAKIEDSGSSPSFSCYSSDSLTSMAASKVIREEQQQQQQHKTRFHEFHDFDEQEDFEFLVLNHDQIPPEEEIDSKSWTVFPLFNRDLMANNDEELDREIEAKNDEIDREIEVKNDEIDREIEVKNDEIDREIEVKNDVSASSITGTLRKLFIDEHEETSSYSSSSEADELESVASGSYCVWRPKSDQIITKCKKSNSTGGSGSKRWRIRYLLRRSNSEGKDQDQPILFVTSSSNNKKIDSPKAKRNSGEVSSKSSSILSRRLLKSETKTPIHEQFYVQKQAENEIVKRKSYLPYRQDLVGLFANHNNRMGKIIPF